MQSIIIIRRRINLL